MMDNKDFFQNATLKICGSLKIEKALWQCLLYIRDIIPASQMSLHLYNQSTGISEIIAHATPDTYKAMSVKIQISQKGRKQIEKWSQRIYNVAKAKDDVIVSESTRHLGCQDMSCMLMDLVIEEQFLGVVAVHGNPKDRFTTRHEQLLCMLNEPFSIAFANNLQLRELHKLQQILVDNNRYLQDELRCASGEEVIGAEFGLKETMRLVRQVAGMDSPVLLLGETGVGKELIANSIHNLSSRREEALIKVNCGAIPDSLIDSELFGHEKGAFTGAVSKKRGRFERAHQGTIFLDEVGELPAEAQVRMLRVLQEKEIERVGGTKNIPVNIRVIAATHRNLDKMMAAKLFRKDLYFRLNVFPIRIPPLRHRISDIPVLVQHFIQKKCQELNLGRVPVLSPDAMDRLLNYPWPGNVRELENIVERELILNQGDILIFKNIGGESITGQERSGAMDTSMISSQDALLSLDQAMAEHIREALKRCNGRVEGKRGAAALLKINPGTLRHRMKKLCIAFRKQT